MQHSPNDSVKFGITFEHAGEPLKQPSAKIEKKAQKCYIYIAPFITIIFFAIRYTCAFVVVVVVVVFVVVIKLYSDQH